MSSNSVGQGTTMESGGAGGAALSAAAPRLAGAADYAAWKLRFAAHLMKIGIEESLYKAVTERLCYSSINSTLAACTSGWCGRLGDGRLSSIPSHLANVNMRMHTNQPQQGTNITSYTHRPVLSLSHPTSATNQHYYRFISLLSFSSAYQLP
jgi:hypothetical protein